MAAMRPLMAAEPMLRAPRPAVVSESTRAAAPETAGGAGAGRFGSAGAGAGVAGAGAAAAWPPPSGRTGAPAAGLAKRRSSRATFASIRSQAYWALLAAELPFPPMAKENGRYQPFTGL